jgi:hypothetical protein
VSKKAACVSGQCDPDDSDAHNRPRGALAVSGTRTLSHDVRTMGGKESGMDIEVACTGWSRGAGVTAGS